jgi:zinc transporter ZupT
VPEALSASAGLAKQGRSAGSSMRMWAVVVVAWTLAPMAGYGLLGGASVETIAFLSAFAAGAIFTMLASTMAPEAAQERSRQRPGDDRRLPDGRAARLRGVTVGPAGGGPAGLTPGRAPWSGRRP